MAIKAIPTSSDIYLELDGRKIAVVQSYRLTAKKSERSIEAFGEREPVATIVGQPVYTIELSRLYATEGALSDGISFHDADDFSLVIVKPDRRVVFTGCKWCAIAENGELGDTVAEKVSIVATNRVETSA